MPTPVFTVTEAAVAEVPILISSPHSGLEFPSEVARRIDPQLLARPDDADFFIDRLYDFAPSLGITVMAARYHRWVIDLNRDPESRPLYTDGRVITGLVPETDFNGRPIYTGETPDNTEIEWRKNNWFDPYHREIERRLTRLRDRFGTALLFDAHSIRRHVPGICPRPFPDLILGDNDETSASVPLIRTALGALHQKNYDLGHNHPFKGGYITRHFGDPANGIHAIQLEMSKTNYMDDDQRVYHDARAGNIRTVLKKLMHSLIKTMAV